MPRNCLKCRVKLLFEIAIIMWMYQTLSIAALTCLRVPVNCHSAIRYPVGKPVVTSKAGDLEGHPSLLDTSLSLSLSFVSCTQIEVPGSLATPAYQHRTELGRKYRQNNTQSSYQNRNLVGCSFVGFLKILCSKG